MRKDLFNEVIFFLFLFLIIVSIDIYVKYQDNQETCQVYGQACTYKIMKDICKCPEGEIAPIVNIITLNNRQKIKLPYIPINMSLIEGYNS